MYVSYLFDFFIVSSLIRFLIGYWGYSGFNTPPLFGDFEAQRHWLEITINLSIGDWYRQSKLNDLSYWGLDYPPLTAYVSFSFGNSSNQTKRFPLVITNCL
jgi:alpha-1,3-glucosyltransferase